MYNYFEPKISKYISKQWNFVKMTNLLHQMRLPISFLHERHNKLSMTQEPLRRS